MSVIEVVLLFGPVRGGIGVDLGFRHAAEKGGGPVVAIQPSFRGCRRIGRSEAGIAVGRVQGEKLCPPLDAGDDRIRLDKVRLGIARRLRQRHEHRPETTAPFPNVILNDGLPSREAMLVAKAFELCIKNQ